MPTGQEPVSCFCSVSLRQLDVQVHHLDVTLVCRGGYSNHKITELIPRNVHLNLPEPSVTSSNGFCWPNDSPKHKNSSVIILNDTEKRQSVKFRKLSQQYFWLFCLKNTERLINYKNSWQFIFHQSINRSLVAALFVTVRKQARISIDCRKINSKLYNIVCIVTCVHTGSLQFCIASCLSVLTGTAESNRAIVNVTSYACSLSVVWWNEVFNCNLECSAL